MFWLKALGHAKWSLPDDWLRGDGGLQRLVDSGYPRRPRIAPGDRLVYYASGWRRVFAIVEATEGPRRIDHERWPWRVAVEPLVVIPLLSNAPPVEAIGVAPRSMSQQSHIRLGPEHYERAVEAIASVAAAPPISPGGDRRDGGAAPSRARRAPSPRPPSAPNHEW